MELLEAMPSQKALGKAIRMVREKRDLTLRQLAERIGKGWSHPDIQLRETGKRRCMPSDLAAIAKALDETPEEIERIAAKLDASVTPDDPDSRPAGMIPLINYAPAGPAADYIEWGTTTADAPEYIDSAGLAGEDLFAVRIRGESMAPKIREYDVIVFRWLNPHADGGHPPIRDGAIVFIRYAPERNSLCTVGRWYGMPGGGIQLRKDNPRHATIMLNREDVEQVGRFVQLRTERED